jgi:hypothetical protein
LSSTVAARDGVDAWVQQGLDAGANVVVYPPPRWPTVRG